MGAGRVLAAAVGLFLAYTTLACAQDPPLHPGGEIRPPTQEVGGELPARDSSRPITVRHSSEAFWAVLTLLVCGLPLGFALLGLLMVIGPDYTERMTAHAPGSFRKRFFVGVVNTVFLVFLAAAMKGPPAVLLVALFFPGLLILSDETGRRIARIAGRDAGRWTRLATGWSLLYVASCFPFLGWFLVGPVVGLTAVGAALLWFLSKKPAPVPPAPGP